MIKTEEGSDMKRLVSLLSVTGIIAVAVFSQSCASKSELEALRKEVENLKKETQEVRKETEEVKKEAQEIKRMAEEISRKIDEHVSDTTLHPGQQ